MDSTNRKDLGHPLSRGCEEREGWVDRRVAVVPGALWAPIAGGWTCVTKTYNTRPDSFFKGSRGCGEPRLVKRPRPRGDPGDLEAVATITSANSLASHPSASLLLPGLQPCNIDILGVVHNGLPPRISSHIICILKFGKKSQ